VVHSNKNYSLPEPRHRDVIVIGSSAGGVGALGRLLAQLPADLPAAVFITNHIPADFPSALAAILNRDSRLPAETAEDDQPIEWGRVYLAPPNYHLLIHDSRIQLSHGPKENRVRPAIDPMFRSAAATLGPRVIGVILTGLLDDGAAGLAAVKRCGGVAVVQDPRDADFSSMPASALRATRVDYCVPLYDMGSLLEGLVREPGDEVGFDPSRDLIQEKIFLKTGGNDMTQPEFQGPPTRFVCPECGGALMEIRDENVKHYRCSVGHAFTPHHLLNGQAEVVDQSLWAAVRRLEEHAELLEKLEREAEAAGRKQSMAFYANQAQENRRHAQTIRDLLLTRAPALAPALEEASDVPRAAPEEIESA